MHPSSYPCLQNKHCCITVALLPDSHILSSPFSTPFQRLEEHSPVCVRAQSPSANPNGLLQKPTTACPTVVTKKKVGNRSKEGNHIFFCDTSISLFKMPNNYQLRRRTSDRDASVTQPANIERSTARSRRKALLKSVRNVFFVIVKLLFAAVVGATVASSFSRPQIAAYLFIADLLIMFTALLISFISVARKKDSTTVYMPDVHLPDGTVSNQPQMTVFDHDNKCATYFAREMPCMALGAAWFFLWTRFNPIIAVYTFYLAVRFSFHPFFRIHLWKEPPCEDLERPFGAVPLFKDDDSSHVKVVEGNTQFEDALKNAPKGTLVVVDCSATWCGPCKQMAPVFEQIAQEFPTATFLSIDVDISRDVASNLAITSIPSFVIYKDTQKMEMFKGADPKKLRATIRSYM